MRIFNTKIAAGVIGCLMAISAHAVPTVLSLGLTGAGNNLVLGEAIFNGNQSLIPSGGQEARDLTIINTLVGIYNGTTTQVAPYHLSDNNLGAAPLPAAGTTGDIITSKSGISFAADGKVTITLGAGFKYLIAAYDGQNSGAVVWDVSGIAAGTTIEFTAYAKPNYSGTDLINGKYGITTWSLYKPCVTTNNRVPDGGSTMILLGSALLGLVAMRRLAVVKS